MRIDVYRSPDGWRWAVYSRNGLNVANGGEAYERPQKLLATLRKYVVRGDPALEAALVKALAKVDLTPTGAGVE